MNGESRPLDKHQLISLAEAAELAQRDQALAAAVSQKRHRKLGIRYVQNVDTLAKCVQ